jgi:hypothetical protein
MITHKNQKGFALIYLVFIMLTLAGMGAAIYSFTTSTAYTELTENNRNRAYQLAVAGMNYAAEQFAAGVDLNHNNFQNKTYTLANSRGQITYSVGIAGSGIPYYDVFSIGTVNATNGVLLARAQVRSSGVPDTPNYFPVGPLVNSPVANSTFQTLTAFDPPSIKDAANHTMISIQSYVATGGAHMYWAAFTNLGTYPVPDADNAGCNMGYHVGRLATNYLTPLRDSWTDFNHVDYDVQVKVGWYMGLPAAVSGINFRWHDMGGGKYEGYGLSFMRYTYSAAGCGGGYDYIPNSVKPPGLANKLLLLLWEQRVVGGVERRRWLAYADLGNPALWAGGATPNANITGNDRKVVGAQDSVDGLLNDNSLLLVRVRDKFVQGDRVNEINIFYGDASPYYGGQRTPGSICTDVVRKRMSPEWVNATLFPSWPANKLGLFDFTDAGLVNHHVTNFWVADPHTTNTPTYYDFFTLNSCSNAIGPEPPGTTTALNPVRLILNPAYADPSSDPNVNPVNKDLVKLLRYNSGDGQWYDEATLRTYKFVLDNFTTKTPELGIHGMGNLNNSDRVVAFDDWAIQILGRRER